MRTFSRLVFTAVLAAGLIAPASADTAIDRMLAGESAIQGEQLEKALEAASLHPFGSKLNPVRAHMHSGQRAYLARLRCEDGTALQFRRRGNAGSGPYGNIIDKYQLRCGSDNSTLNEVYMDMYHKGHVENAPVPGYTIIAVKAGEAADAAPQRETTSAPMPNAAAEPAPQLKPAPLPQSVPATQVPAIPVSEPAADPADAT